MLVRRAVRLASLDGGAGDCALLEGGRGRRRGRGKTRKRERSWVSFSRDGEREWRNVSR